MAVKDVAAEDSQHHSDSADSGVAAAVGCPHCDPLFFKLLSETIVGVAGNFSEAARRILEVRMSHGIRCLLLRVAGKDSPSVLAPASECVLNYVVMNYQAVRKILKKYEKVHGAHVRSEIKASLGSMQSRVLRSPLLVELAALCANFQDPEGILSSSTTGPIKQQADVSAPQKAAPRESETHDVDASGVTSEAVMEEVQEEEGTAGCLRTLPGESGAAIAFADAGVKGRGGAGASSLLPVAQLTLENELVLPHSLGAHVDVTCPICLEVAFDPVSLGCGHIFCFSCACSVANVPSVVGLQGATPASKCPVCRKPGMFRQPVKLNELNLLIKARYPDYWRDRQKRERRERVQEAKEFWQREASIFLGL